MAGGDFGIELRLLKAVRERVAERQVVVPRRIILIGRRGDGRRAKNQSDERDDKSNKTLVHLFPPLRWTFPIRYHDNVLASTTVTGSRGLDRRRREQDPGPADPTRSMPRRRSSPRCRYTG